MPLVNPDDIGVKAGEIFAPEVNSRERQKLDCHTLFLHDIRHGPVQGDVMQVTVHAMLIKRANSVDVAITCLIQLLAVFHDVFGDQLGLPLLILLVNQIFIFDHSGCLLEAKKFAALFEMFLTNACIFTGFARITRRHAKQVAIILSLEV